MLDAKRSAGVAPEANLMNPLQGSIQHYLAIVDISAVQSSAQTFIHNAVLFIDTSNNA